MQRFHQAVFVASLLALSWFAMMAFHELGHVVGALATGGAIEQVVLHPLTISRTDVSPNPSPLIVVWLGPVLGCVFPAICYWLVPQRLTVANNIAMFFAGFCLIANGAYVAFGSLDRVGDCGVMLQQGSPLWTLLLFGALTITLGFFVWHRMGSIRRFFNDPSLINPRAAYALLGALVLVLTLGFVFSPI